MVGLFLSVGFQRQLACSALEASPLHVRPEKEKMGGDMKDGGAENLPKERKGCLQADLHLSLLHIEDVPEKEKKNIFHVHYCKKGCTMYIYMLEET